MPRPSSAKVEAHWLTACSEAPEQTIMSISTQKNFSRKSSGMVMPFSPSSCRL